MIVVDNVTKRFRIYRRNGDRLRELLTGRTHHEAKVAVRDVSLRLDEGEVVGIIGRNGAGKSTLLKMVMGVILPDEGNVTVSGRVTGLLELGTGFNALLSGYDNIAFNAALLGMTPAEVARQRDAIIAFSELQAAIHNPLRTYSSGMIMRLAFSIAVHADPVCLVVDEALAVGDAHFQQKCMRRIAEFRKAGGSILFVSHDMNAVKVLCDRAVVLEEGAIAASGTPESAVNYYNRMIAAMEGEDMALVAPLEQRGHAATSYGNGALGIVGGRLIGADSGGSSVASGEVADLVIDVHANQAIDDASLGIMIRDRLGQDIFGTNTHHMGQPLRFAAGEDRRFVFRMPMNLSPGRYTVTVALHSDDTHLSDCYHWCDNLLEFEVAGYLGPRFNGICRLEPTFLVAAEPGLHA